MGKIVDVKKIVENKKKELKEKVKELKSKNIYPKLAVILANSEESSKIYVGKKQQMCSELGIEDVEYVFDENVTTTDILDLIERLNNDSTVHGILVQLPLFKHLDENMIISKISPKKDVDGFHPENLGKILIGKEDGLIACTPKGIMGIIDSLNEEIVGKNAVVVGRSIIVGKPISQLLLSRGATVTTCHSKTSNLEKHTKMADILVVATGVPHLITASMVKKGAIVVDGGITRVDGKIFGDVDTENVVKKAKYITPVPGGVGRTTVISLMENVIKIAENEN